MKLLLTGGTSFIGSRLALAARQRGIDVAVTAHVNTPIERARLAALERQGITATIGTLQDRYVAASVVGEHDTVIHLAGAQPEARCPDSYFEAINVTGTRALIEASRAAGVRRFVYVSTVGVYGETTGGTLDESSPPQPANIYGRAKLAAEQVVKSLQDSLEVTIVRISQVYGPGDLRLLELFRAIERRRFVMIGDGLNRHQGIYVDDLTRGLLVAAEHPAAPNQTFLMAGREVLSTAEIVAQIAAVLHRSEPRWRIPLAPALLAAPLCERTLRPLGISPPLDRRRLDFYRKLFSTAKAHAILGFDPVVTFLDGACATAQWYCEQGLLASHAVAESATGKDQRLRKCAFAGLRTSASRRTLKRRGSGRCNALLTQPCRSRHVHRYEPPGEPIVKRDRE